MEIESSLKTKWQRIKCKINALLGFYRKTNPYYISINIYN